MKWLRKLPVGRRRRFSFKSEQIISMNIFLLSRIGRLLCGRGCSSFVIVDGVMCVTLYLRLIRAWDVGAGCLPVECEEKTCMADMAMAGLLTSFGQMGTMAILFGALPLDLYVYLCVPLSCGYLETKKELETYNERKGFNRFLSNL